MIDARLACGVPEEAPDAERVHQVGGGLAPVQCIAECRFVRRVDRLDDRPERERWRLVPAEQDASEEEA